MNTRGNNDFSRRRFLTRSGAIGVGLGAVGLSRFGGGTLFAAGNTTVPGTGAGGAFDPMRYAGQTVSIMLVDGERDDLGLRDKLDEIRETMGLEVEVSTLALGPLLESNNQNLRADQSAFDIAHILGFSVAGTVGAGLLAPLNDYVSDPARTPEGYDLEDFPAGQLEYCGYFDIEAGQFGGDQLYLIPGIHSGSVIMYYRTDLYEEAGLSVPTNWEDYLANAEALHQGDVSGTSMIGANDVSLFLVDWYSRFITMGGQLMNGAPSTQDFEPNLTSEPAVRALQHMVDCAAVSPSGVTSYGFTESVDAFSVGNTGVEGLIHVSEMSWTKRVATLEGAEPGRGGRRGRPRRRSGEPPHLARPQAGRAEPVGDGKINHPDRQPDPGQGEEHHRLRHLRRVDEGIDGLVHVSDLHWTKKLKHPSDLYKKGDDVEAVVLGDRRRERAHLARHQAAQEDPWNAMPSRYPGRRPRAAARSPASPTSASSSSSKKGSRA